MFNNKVKFLYHLKPVAHCVRWGSLTYQGKWRFGGQTHSQNMQLQIVAKPSVLWCHLANTNEELDGRAIPPFAKLVWFLLLMLLLLTAAVTCALLISHHTISMLMLMLYFAISCL